MIEHDASIKVQSWGSRISFNDGHVMARMGTEMARAMRRRIQDKGIDDLGRPFPPYSDDWPRRGLKLPVRGSGRWGRISGGTPTGKGNRMRYFESIRAFRQAQGLPVDRIRFSLTGKMWDEMLVHVRLVFGIPEIVLRFKGNLSDAHSQDYSLQLRAAARQKYGDRGYRHHRTGRETTHKRWSPKVARSAMKSAMQWRFNEHDRPWFAPTQKEVEAARDLHLADLSKQLRSKLLHYELWAKHGRARVTHH